MDKKKRNYIIGGVVLFFVILGFTNNDQSDESTNPTETPSLSEEVKNAIAESKVYAMVASIMDSRNSTTKVTEQNIENLSESEYKIACKELWHDDIFFSKSDLGGQYVKLDLFAEEPRYFNLTQDSDTANFIKKYDLKRDFTLCGVNRKDANSYISGQVTLYMPNSIDITLKTGKHYIAYGQIVEYSTNTYTGYNKCSFLPKYIEVK